MLGALLTAALLLAGVREVPTRNGDPIGTATLDRHGSLGLRLRSVQCDGTIAEGQYDVPPTDPAYRKTLKWVGAIRPGRDKPLSARGVRPCPKRR